MKRLLGGLRVLTGTQLADMRETEITKTDRASLIDINNVIIDASLPSERRTESFITQISNPYCFLCGETPVRVRFVSPNKPLAGSLGDYFISLK